MSKITVVTEPVYHKKVKAGKKIELDYGEAEAMFVGCLCAIKWFKELEPLMEQMRVTFHQSDIGETLIPKVEINLTGPLGSRGKIKTLVVFPDFNNSMSYSEIARRIIAKVKKAISQSLYDAEKAIEGVRKNMPKDPEKEISKGSTIMLGT